MDDPQALVSVARHLSPRVSGDPTSFIVDVAADPGISSSLRAYSHLLLKHRWLILTASLTLGVLEGFYSFKTKPVYRATARIQIEADNPILQSVNDLYRNVPYEDATFLATQVDVLRSRTLAWQTVQQLRLFDHPEFGSRGKPTVGQVGSSTDAEAALTQAFLGRLIVEQKKNTRMIEVSFESADRDLGPQVVNSLVNNYIELNFRLKYDATRQATAWMEEQLQELKVKMENSEQALVDYERRNSIVNLGEKESITEQRLRDLSRDYTQAQSERLQKDSILRLISSSESQVGDITQDGLLQKLQDREADLKQQYADLQQRYGPNFPRAARLVAQLSELSSLIERQRKQDLERLHSEYKAAQVRETLLAEELTKQKAELGRLNQLMIQHNLLKREFETNQQLYGSLLQRLKDANISAGLRATNVHVIDPALAATHPVRPQKTRNVAIGLTFGLLLGITLSLLKDGLDNSIASPEALEKVGAAPALALIPPLRTKGAAQPRLGHNGSDARSKNGKAELATLQQPTSVFAESYKSLCTSILLSTAPRAPQVVLVTSACPSEGKTTSSVNLALALAQRQRHVLIVDADLRKPMVAPVLGLPQKRGLTGVLTGNDSLDAAIQPFGALPNLKVLPAGHYTPDPIQLLSSPKMREVVQQLRQRFDHIVLDSPPLLVVTDGTILSTIVDGVVLVVQCSKTPSPALIRARKILEVAGARLLGTVLNKFDMEGDGYYYYYSGYYGNQDGSHHHNGSGRSITAKTREVPHFS